MYADTPGTNSPLLPDGKKKEKGYRVIPLITTSIIYMEEEITGCILTYGIAWCILSESNDDGIFRNWYFGKYWFKNFFLSPTQTPACGIHDDQSQLMD